MTRAFRWGCLSTAILLLAACASRVPYQPRNGVLDGVSEEEQRRAFGEALTRATKPRIAQVRVDDASYGYDIWRGRVSQPTETDFANISRIDLYSNNAVLVLDRNDRVVSKVAFGNPTDARSFIDVLSYYRARRLQGGAPTAGSATAP